MAAANTIMLSTATTTTPESDTTYGKEGLTSFYISIEKIIRQNTESSRGVGVDGTDR